MYRKSTADVFDENRFFIIAIMLPAHCSSLAAFALISPAYRPRVRQRSPFARKREFTARAAKKREGKKNVRASCVSVCFRPVIDFWVFAKRAARAKQPPYTLWPRNGPDKTGFFRFSDTARSRDRRSICFFFPPRGRSEISIRFPVNRRWPDRQLLSLEPRRSAR